MGGCIEPENRFWGRVVDMEATLLIVCRSSIKIRLPGCSVVQQLFRELVWYAVIVRAPRLYACCKTHPVNTHAVPVSITT